MAKLKNPPHRTKAVDYEYEQPDGDIDIPESRKNEIINELKRNIDKKATSIPHYLVLNIGFDNPEELQFMYDWLGCKWHRN